MRQDQFNKHSPLFTFTTTMKFNTCNDKSLQANSSSVNMFVHENKSIPDKHTSTDCLGRYECMEPTVFFTPVLSSQRVDKTKRSDLISIDDLVKDLGKLLISDDDKASPSNEKTSHASGSKTPSPQVVRLLEETPEAFDENLGRCVQSMIDGKTSQVIHVTRSLRLK